MGKRLKVYDDYYVNYIFEDTRLRDLWYSSNIEIEYGAEGYVLIFNNILRRSSLYIPFIKHNIPVILEACVY